MSTSTYPQPLQVAQGWIYALKGIEHPEPRVLRAAEAAYNALDALDVTPSVASALTDLAAELVAARGRALAAQPDDPHYIPGWSGPRDGQRIDVEAPKPDPEILAAIHAALDAPEPRVAHVSEVEPWTGWGGPAPALPGENLADLADRVAGDLDGAADLITALASELGVPKEVGDGSSVNIARACAAGAATLRVLAGRGDQEPAGERPASTPEELIDLRIRSQGYDEAKAMINTLGQVRDQLVQDVERLEAQVDEQLGDLARVARERDQARAELEELGEELQDVALRGTKARERAERAERAAADLRPQIATLRQKHHDATERAALLSRRTDGRVSLINVLKALGAWVPGFEGMSTEELGAEAEKVARAVLSEQQTAHGSHQALVRELRNMPGVRTRQGPILQVVRDALTELEAVKAELGATRARVDVEARRYDAAHAELEATRTELATASSAWDLVNDERDRALAELNAAVTERDQAVAGLDRLTKELASQRPARGAVAGVIIPPVQPHPGVTDLRPSAQDGKEPPL